MKRRTLAALLISCVLICPTVYANPESMTLYSLDGRSEVVAFDDVAAWQQVGWYTAPVTMMYAPDGRQAVVVNTDVEAWKRVGWYDYIPTATLYAPDGRMENVALWDVEAWKQVGWIDAAGYNALLQANKAYPLFSLASDYYIGNIRMGMTYSEFYSLYGGNILSESAIEEGMDDYFFSVELDGAYLNFSNYYSRYNKNSFTLSYFYTESDKWSFARGIRVGESVENVYSRLPYTGYYYDGDAVGRYVFDMNLRKLDKLVTGKEIYAFTKSNPYYTLFKGYYRSDGFGGLLKFTEKGGYIKTVEMFG